VFGLNGLGIYCMLILYNLCLLFVSKICDTRYSNSNVCTFIQVTVCFSQIACVCGLCSSILQDGREP